MHYQTSLDRLNLIGRIQIDLYLFQLEQYVLEKCQREQLQHNKDVVLDKLYKVLTWDLRLVIKVLCLRPVDGICDVAEESYDKQNVESFKRTCYRAADVLAVVFEHLSIDAGKDWQLWYYDD